MFEVFLVHGWRLFDPLVNHFEPHSQGKSFVDVVNIFRLAGVKAYALGARSWRRRPDKFDGTAPGPGAVGFVGCSPAPFRPIAGG